ncbi:MAG: hypothetical protein RSD12_05055 [Akkermansia sp.]
MAVIVVDHAKFRIVDFATPLEGLVDACGCDGSVGSVVVGGGDCSVRFVEFRDVFCEVVLQD